MPGWAVGNIAIGLIMGMSLKYIEKINNKVLQFLTVSVVAVISTFVGIELIKSFIDSIVVGQPFIVRFGKNLTSFISDAFVIVASLPICILVEKQAKSLRYK